MQDLFIITDKGTYEPNYEGIEDHAYQLINTLSRIADASERIAAAMERQNLTTEGTINNTHLV